MEDEYKTIVSTVTVSTGFYHRHLLRQSEGARIWNAWTAVLMMFVVAIETEEGWQ